MDRTTSPQNQGLEWMQSHALSYRPQRIHVTHRRDLTREFVTQIPAAVWATALSCTQASAAPRSPGLFRDFKRPVRFRLLPLREFG